MSKKFPYRCISVLLCILLCLPLCACRNDSQTQAFDDTQDEPVQLVVGCWATAVLLQKLADQFNASQSEYEIVLYDYWEEMGLNSPSMNELETARTRMHMELATGERPDLIAFCGGFNIMALIYSGLLMDLKPLMTNDPDFHREDYHPTLFELMEVNGSLYELPVVYELEGIIAPESVVGSRIGWTIEDYLKLEQATGEPLMKQNAEDLLLYYICFGLSDYINVDDGTCSFDSASFQKLLTFIKDADDKLATYSGSRQEPVFLWRIPSVKDWNRWIDDWSWRYGEKPVLLGYPQDSAYSPAASALKYSFGICSDTKYADGCWAFLKFLLSEETQISMETRGIPVLNCVLEDQLERSMLPADDPNSLIYGSKKTDRSGEPREPLTQEDVDRLRELIYGVSIVRMVYYDIETILTEEAQAYFAGDKTVEETCKLIQSRASLFLAEQYRGHPAAVPTEPAPEPAAPADGSAAAAEEAPAEPEPDRTPIYPDAGYTIENNAVVIDGKRFPLNTTTLCLKDADLSDYRFLAELTQLTQLELSDDAATIDLTPLAGLPYLEQVSIYSANVENSDLSPLAQCPALRTLVLEFIKTDLDAVGEMTQLTDLAIVFTSFDDLSFLENLTNLERLTILGTMAADIAPLIEYQLPKLKELQCPIYEGQLEQLKAAYPDCEIIGHLRQRDPEE